MNYSLPFEIQEKILENVDSDPCITQKIKELGFEFLYKKKILNMDNPWDYLVKNRDPETMEWLVKTPKYSELGSGKFLNEELVIIAVNNHDLDSVKWLVLNNCPRGRAYAISALNTQHEFLVGWLTLNDNVFRTNASFLRPWRHGIKNRA